MPATLHMVFIIYCVGLWMLHLATGIQKVDNTIYWISLYPVDNEIGFPTTYPLDSDLTGG